MEIDLADLAYDFEGYFDRWKAGATVDGEEQEFDARAIGIFCRRMLLNGDANAPWSEWEAFAAYYLAKKLRWVVGGVPWRKEFDLPFPLASHESDYSRANSRAIDIFCAVHNAATADPSLNITDLIRAESDKRCVSFETARADYYRVKGWIEAGEGFRPALRF